MTAAAKLNRTTLRTSRLMEFCSVKELTAQTGHHPDQWPLVILKELVDNALDACEEARITPAINVDVDADGIAISDNGPGLPADTIAGILDFSVRVSSREAYVAPDRGAQGNALKTLVAMPFVLDRDQGQIEVSSRGTRHCIKFAVDAIRQEPRVIRAEEQTDVKNGTEVRVLWPSSACSTLESAKSRFLQIAEDYTWLNPHLSLVIDWFGDRIEIGCTDPDWRKWSPSEPTSAHWYSEEHFKRLIAGYLAHDEDCGRDRTVRELVAEFRGFSGSAKQKRVLDATGLHRAPLRQFVNGTGDVDDHLAFALLSALKEHSKSVKPAALGIIGKEHLRQRFEAAGCEMESFDYRKVVDTTDGIPWVVETAFGWCPKSDGRRLVTGVNWSSGIVNPFRELGRYGRSLDTVLSQQRTDQDEPVILILHMACPRVEYTDRGKSAVVVRA